MGKKKKKSAQREIIEITIDKIVAANTGVYKGKYFFNPCIISSKPVEELKLPDGWSYSKKNSAIISGSLYINVLPW